MKVAIIYDLSEPGGVQTCVFSLIRGLNRKAILPTVYWDSEPSRKLVEENHVEINYEKMPFRISSSLIKKLPNTIRYLLWPFNILKISKIAIDCDYLFLFSPLILIDKPRPHLFYLSGPPLIPQLQSKSIVFRLAKSIYGLFIRPFYPAYEPQANAIYVINSHYTADLFKQAHGRELEVVYPANQLTRRMVGDNDIQSRDTITFFSRIVNYKRPELLIALAERHPEFRYVIMGGVSDGRWRYYNKLRHIAEKKKLNNITFYPNASRETINAVLGRTRIYFFPAINEHFGITTVESILKGCVPFVHNSGGQKEIVPFDELRFNEGDLFDKFDALLNKTPEILRNWQRELVIHCQKFTDEAFVNDFIKRSGIF